MIMAGRQQMQDIAWAEYAAQLEQIYAQEAEQIAYSEVDIDELLKADETVGIGKCILFSIVVHRFG